MVAEEAEVDPVEEDLVLGGGSGASGGSGYRRVGDDRTANLFVDNITNRDGNRWNRS